MMVPFLFVPTLQLLRCNRQTLHHFNILCRSDVPAADLDKALDRVSAYYHKYIDKGRLPTEAYAKVLKRFPDAVFHCYTYPKVIFATTLQQLCILTLNIALQRTEKYKLRSMTMMCGCSCLRPSLPHLPPTTSATPTTPPARAGVGAATPSPSQRRRTRAT